MRRAILALVLLAGCGGESEGSAYVYSHTLDVRDSATGCVSVESLSDAVRLRCDDKGPLVERCDDLAAQVVGVYAIPGTEDSWMQLRLKSCEAE